LKTFTRREFIGTAALLGIAGLGRPVEALAAAAGSYRLGCYTRPWDRFDYREALDGIAEAGFHYAGIMTAKGQPGLVIHVDSTPEAVAAVAGEVKRRGLETLSIYGGGFHANTSVQAGVTGLKTLIDHSAICACPNLLLGGTTDPKVFDRYYQAVAECCDYAAAKGVGLSVKPHGGQNSTGPQCRKIIERVGHRNFRLWYDPGNIFYYSDGKLDPVTDSSTVDGLVVGMSVKDFTPPKEVLVTPGTGQVNFREVLAHLGRGGFRSGPLIVECVARADSPSTITAQARQARQFLEALTRAD